MPAPPWKSGASETVSQPPFRTFDACSFTTFYPRLAPWAALLRRFAARIVTRGPLFVQSGGCDTVSSAPGIGGSRPSAVGTTGLSQYVSCIVINLVFLQECNEFVFKIAF